MNKYCYIITEGPQDIAFLIKLLKSDGMQQVEKATQVDIFWKSLIPTKFPYKDDLNKQVPVPKFLEGNGLSIALQSATGESGLADTIEVDLKIISKTKLTGVGIILDADNIEPQKRFDQMKKELEKLDLDIPNQPGIVSTSGTRSGVFILPDNQSKGTLENILIECGERNYTQLMELSREYISKIDESKIKLSDLKKYKKPAGKNKAIIGIVSNILRPGRTLQVSLQDNNWIDNTTLQLDKIKSMKNFLNQIMNIN